MSKRRYSRREFLGTASCAALGSTTLFNALLNLGMTNALAKPSRPGSKSNSDYRALVCILLAGGNDSYNMLVPAGGPAYADYAITRSNLALLQGDLLPLNFTDALGRSFGVHPSMPEVQGLFNSGKLAFLSNVGTLVQPATKAQVLAKSVPMPSGLLSHADQIQQWQTSMPQSRSARGWGGRMADILSAMNNNSNVSMGISLGGTNVFQAGENATEFTIQNSGSGSVGIHVFDSNQSYDQLIRARVDSLLNQQYQDIFKQTFRDRVRHAQDTHTEFSNAIDAVPPFSTPFSNNRVSRDMHMIAKTIAARDLLDMSRQTFFVLFGGWDHHDEVLNNQQAMLAVVSKALGEFQSTMEELGIDDCVTTFTISDFGRTLTSNGNGTDHAWGGNVIVMGGDVNGGLIYGNYPGLALGGPDEIGGGVLVPGLSTDVYFAELAMWMGVQPGDLPYVLPNIGHFYLPGSAQPPIGFLNL